MLSRSLMSVLPGALITVVSIFDLTRGFQWYKIMSTLGIAVVLLSNILAVTVLNPMTWQERGGLSREELRLNKSEGPAAYRYRANGDTR